MNAQRGQSHSVFMPVGTAATVKGMMPESVKSTGACIILANTYHLMLRPGAERVDRLGGVRKMMGWDGPLLTDSGGFQMVSLLALAKITEEGVTFQSPVDGSKMLLTPEESMRVQNEIGSDIMMALDDVVSSVTVDDARFREAARRVLSGLPACVLGRQPAPGAGSQLASVLQPLASPPKRYATRGVCPPRGSAH